MVWGVDTPLILCNTLSVHTCVVIKNLATCILLTHKGAARHMFAKFHIRVYIMLKRLQTFILYKTYLQRVLLWELMCRNKAFKLHVHVCLEQEQLVRHQSR